MKKLILLILLFSKINLNGQSKILKDINSPILFKGDEKTAYRDPAILFHNDQFFLFFTLVKTINEEIYSFTATSKSFDLINWSPVKILTPRDQNLNFCSPGNVVRYNGKWLLCLQTYPRPDYNSGDKVRYGSDDSRIFTMDSKDLENWSPPRLLKVKGPSISKDKMGRMIDPYLIEDKDEKGKWWCFYKQNGVSMSYTYDFLNWTFYGNTKSGENVCMLNDEGEYVMFHSPSNGIGIMRSSNLKDWHSFGNLITLGQKHWRWAKGRITAGAVIDLREIKGIERYVMFFHGSGPNKESEGDFDKNSSLGIAWSDDLVNWDWPKK
jgi:hypothetical protein